MNSKLKRYAIEQLASTGFVLLDYKQALMLRPDIWATPMNCMCDVLLDQQAEIGLARLGAILFEAMVPGENITMRGATRSMRGLAQRIEQITGLVVADAGVVETFSNEMAAKLARHQPKIGTPVKADNTAELQEVAAMGLPGHDCALRKQILRARQELTERGLIN